MYGQIIHRVFDDSYVITKNGMPYHVYPYAAEFAEEWDAVFAYADAHPECVTEEQPYVPPVPTLDEAKAAKLSEINAAADRAISKLTATYPCLLYTSPSPRDSTLWSGCSPRPTPLPWRPVQLSASVRHWKIGLMPVRRWKRCRAS